MLSFFCNPFFRYSSNLPANDDDGDPPQAHFRCNGNPARDKMLTVCDLATVVCKGATELITVSPWSAIFILDRPFQTLHIRALRNSTFPT
jgi:hypothetical protein